MKRINSLYIFFFLVFITGICLKFFRTPFHTIIMLVGLGGILIVSFAYIFKKNNQSGFLSLTSVASAAWLISVLKFWPGVGLYFLIISLILVTLSVWFIVRGKRPYRLHAIPIIITLAFASILGSMKRSDRYYLLNIRFNKHVAADYYALDKYSWFLHLDARNDEARNVVQEAFVAVLRTNDEPMRRQIKSHLEQLEKGEWRTY